MHYYKRHIGDYAKDTGHLSMLEDGAYSRMMDWCYASEKPLPDDNQRLFTITRAMTPVEKKAALSVRAEFFQITEGGWVQKRIEKEIDHWHVKQGKARESAEKRWPKTHPPADANALPNADTNALPSEVRRDMQRARASHKPLTTNQEPLSSNASASADAGDGEKSRTEAEPHPPPEWWAYWQQAEIYNRSNGEMLSIPMAFVENWWSIRESSEWVAAGGRRIADTEKARWHDLLALARAKQRDGTMADFAKPVSAPEKKERGGISSDISIEPAGDWKRFAKDKLGIDYRGAWRDLLDRLRAEICAALRSSDEAALAAFGFSKGKEGV